MANCNVCGMANGSAVWVAGYVCPECKKETPKLRIVGMAYSRERKQWLIGIPAIYPTRTLQKAINNINQNINDDLVDRHMPICYDIETFDADDIKVENEIRGGDFFPDGVIYVVVLHTAFDGVGGKIDEVLLGYGIATGMEQSYAIQSA